MQENPPVNSRIITLNQAPCPTQKDKQFNGKKRSNSQINKLLEEAGWRFFDDGNRQANIQLEPNVKITELDIDAFGQDFETTKNGLTI